MTPTLLGIYDKIASANRHEDGSEIEEAPFDFFPANENLEDGENNKCHSPKYVPPVSSRSGGRRVKDVHDPRAGQLGWGSKTMETTADDGDNKKRPLSLSSMSSSSSSSLPRQHKRPNLAEYNSDGSPLTCQLDIEKIDNILYIDDGPEPGELGVEPTPLGDNVSLCSQGNHRSCRDTDSQVSADQLERDHHEHSLHKPIPYNQSDSSLSNTPSESTNCSTADLSLNSDLISCDLSQERSRRSPSRSSSQRSGGLSRSGSQKSGHYISYVQRVVTELVETERTYVVNLQDIKQVMAALFDIL